MESGSLANGLRRAGLGRAPGWVLGLLPLVIVAAAVGAFVALGAPGLAERTGPPVEELAVERTVLRPDVIELTVRNDGPDAVGIAQVAVNDGYVDFTASSQTLDRLGSSTLRLQYPWIEGQAYEVLILTTTGATIAHEIPAAVETPETTAGFYGLMALLGVYVGVIPIALGMLWLPFLRRMGPRVIRLVMAVTVGLLLVLAVDAALEGFDVAGAGAQAFGGPALVVLGAGAAYLVLAAVEAAVRGREERLAPGAQLALLIAIGIGLHNLGEGLAIGSAYAVGALALGAFLVVGFAIHNTTEGLAIVAPVAAARPSLRRLAALGLVAGAPAILGAGIGASADNARIAAFLLGAGVGAIVQVVQQLVPAMRDDRGRALYPSSAAAVAAGGALLYMTGLLVSV
jgi:ZIP family zinc transporter